MDCAKGMKLIDDEMIDLTVTSPPYDNLRTYDEYNFDFESTAKQLYRVTKKGGILVWIVSDGTVDGSETETSFKQALYFKDQCGFRIHNTMIYQKNMVPVPSSNRYHQVFEYMFIFSKGKPKTVNLIKDRENKEGKSTWKTFRIRQKDGTFIARRNTKPIQRYGTRFNIWQYNAGFDFSTKNIDAECFKIFNQIGRIIIQSYFL